MAEILTQKLRRHGWPEDEEAKMMDESLLEKSESVLHNDNEHTVSTEWRLDGKIVKRGAHVRLGKNIAADSIAEMVGLTKES